MPRPKGSKNKSINQKIDEIIEDVQKLNVDSEEKSEAIEELLDLVVPEAKEEYKAPADLSEYAKEHHKYTTQVGNRKALGKDPVTGEIVFAD